MANESDAEYVDARDWEKEVNELKSELESVSKAVQSWKNEARSVRRAWESTQKESSARRMKINELR